jgi:hypothetical protein
MIREGEDWDGHIVLRWNEPNHDAVAYMELARRSIDNVGRQPNPFVEIYEGRDDWILELRVLGVIENRKAIERAVSR